MASADSGPDWTANLVSILTSTQTTPSKTDLQVIVKTILQSQEELLEHSDEDDEFYGAVAALSAHTISTHASIIQRSQISITAQACKILIQYFLKKLQNHNESSCLLQKVIMTLIGSLCTNSGSIQKSDVISLATLFKSAKVPSGFNAKLEPCDKKDDSKEYRHPRLDPSTTILEQLMTPVFELSSSSQKQESSTEVIDKEGDTAVIHIPDPGLETRTFLQAKNLVSLQQEKGGDILLNMCLSLPSIRHYSESLKDALSGREGVIPNCIASSVITSNSYKSLLNDTCLVWKALSQPVLEPLSEDRVAKLSTVALSCMHLSIAVTTAVSILGVAGNPPVKGNVIPFKDDENEHYAISIVQTSLDIYNSITNTIRISTRAGGHVLQNLHLLTSVLLLKGLQNILSLNPASFLEKNPKEGVTKSKGTPDQTPTKSRDPSTGSKQNVLKIQQGFGVLPVALANHTLSLMTSILNDLRIEAGMVQEDIDSKLSTAELTEVFLSNIVVPCSAWKRTQILMNFNLTGLLFNLASVSYRKACMLKRIQKHPADGDNFSTSDSNTYYEDDFSSTDDSSVDEDDDSEPILGHWFEETTAPQDNASSTPSQAGGQDMANADGKGSTHALLDGKALIPDKGEPHGYISLATKVLGFIGAYFVNSENKSIQNYLRLSIGPPQMIILAGIIKDLDKETSRSETGTLSIYFGVALGQLYDEFSKTLGRFLHNILATGLLDETLQDGLLTHLNVNPWIQEDWPLQVFPRTLSVLAQILLLRQQKEKDDLRVENDNACVLIWQLILKTIEKSIATPSQAAQVDETEDLNVEHAQLLLFLFHSLQLMQKKMVLLNVAQTIINVSQAVDSPMKDLQVIYLARLLHIFEYLIKNLYEAPSALVDQVQSNLFSIHGSSTSLDKDSNKQQKLYFPCKEVEENFVKNVSSDDAQATSIKPRFYHLMVVESGTQDVPKLDGFASSFLLGTCDVLNYSQLYSSVVYLLNIGNQCDMLARSTDKLPYLGVCAVQYCFSVTWRLLLSLPPSIQALEALSTGNAMLNLSSSLHAIVWVPRVAHKNFTGWVKDSLVKQGLTTQKAESLLRQVTKSCGHVSFDVKIAKQFISKQLTEGPIGMTGIIPREKLPRMLDLFALETLIAKVQVSLDDCLSKPANECSNQEAKQLAQEMFPIMLQLVGMYNVCIRWNLLHLMSETGSSPVSSKSQQAYDIVLQMASGRCARVSNVTVTIAGYLPSHLVAVLEKWNAITVNVCAWRSDFANDNIPSESYISTIQNAHFSALSANGPFTVSSSLKRILQSSVRFAGDLFIWCPEEQFSKDMVRVMLPLLLDASTESQADYITLALERCIGLPDSDEFSQYVYQELLTHCYDLLIGHSNKESSFYFSEIDEHIFHECLKLMEALLDKQPGKKALEKFFTEKDMWNILLSAADGNLSPVYGTRVLKFFSKLFLQIEKNSGDQSLEKLNATLSKMSKLNELDTKALQNWLSKVVTGNSSQNEEGGSVQENRLLLQSLTSYIVKENNSVSKEVASAFLTALIAMGSQILSPASEGIGFSDLMVVMATLAGAGTGKGHLQLFQAATDWLESCKKYLAQKDVVEKLEENITGGKHHIMMESACYLLSYVADLVGSLKLLTERSSSTSTRSGAASPPCDGDIVHHPEADADWVEELGPDDEESGGEDSDEDSLCNKLCTFTITQKEFMNQHWYHCHTCKMVDGVGVCTICAKVCHRDHDVTYAKYGSFFCDCGAKEDGSCQALVKRSPQTGTEGAPSTNQNANFSFPSENILPSSLRRRPSSPTQGASNSGVDRIITVPGASESKKNNEETMKHKQSLSKQLEAFNDILVNHMVSTQLVNTVLELVQFLMPAVVETCHRNSPIGSSARAQKALTELHTQEKIFEHVDQLMVPTLGSQEGAFENVRMNYSGEQGQTIRQLLSSHMIRRVAMCCLASPHGKRQHLAVSHEKGKITLLQLSALLKQADSSKRKLTITRLASAPVPFTVLSITGNPCNEDYLAVCGLKDCHILTFSSSGSVTDHLVLHPQLEIANYIIKAIWLPGSQTELAIVTADFVKIYNLAQDALSAQFYFLLPSGKIRDCCFVFSEDGQRYLLIMSSAGHIYYQPMVEESSAKHGPFYVTNILEIKHPDVKDSSGIVAGEGGVSIYYSHVLQLLFFSYVSGKSFMASLPQMVPEITNPVLIQVKSNNSSSGSNSKPTPQPLCQWSEVPHHPGLVLALMQFSNNPLVLMIKPGTVMVQEIKILTAKSKITDMVAIRHLTSSGEMRTTLILLCEDGSLRIYMANQEHTGYWLMPAFQMSSITPTVKPTKKKKVQKSGRTTNAVSFPIDFFEHCTPLQDIEFGGNDLLQVYNAQQIKHRLNTTGMYVASTKPAGFVIEVTNPDNSMVMVGARIFVGSQDIQRAPSYIEIFGRTHQVTLNRSRWYDFPFTREESLNADKKIFIYFGASSDPSCVTMVDSIKMYGKTKEAFGWPEDSEEFPSATGVNIPGNGPVVGVDADGIPAAPLPLTPLDRLVGSCLEVLDGCFSVNAYPEEKQILKTGALDLATKLLTLPTPPVVHQNVKALLAALHPNRTAYSNHRDQALLSYVLHCLSSAQNENPYHDLDGEAFYRLVAIARGVAVSRPSNLVQFAESQDQTIVADSAENAEDTTPRIEIHEEGIHPAKVSVSTNTCNPGPENSHFMVCLTAAFWHLHSMRPRNPSLAPVSRHGLVHVEDTVQALVEVIHAFTACDLDTVPLAAKLYAKFLLCEDTTVSFAAKQALIRVLRPKLRRRKVFIPSPPHCSTPGNRNGETQEAEANEHKPAPPPTPAPPAAQVHVQNQSSIESQAQEVEAQFDMLEGIEPVVLLPGGADGAANLEALIARQAGFPPLLDIPPDADDETMVELAIALSLQDQPGRSGDLSLQSLALSSQGPQRASSLEGGHYSDTTASAGASDDEGSTAATDGSTLRTSPAEQGGSAGSESGGSGVDSIIGEHNVSGRSSAYGDNVPESTMTGVRSETSSVGMPSTSMPQEVEGLDLETDLDANLRLHVLRMQVLDRLVQFLPDLRKVGGIRAIPYMQVVLMLSSDLDGEEEKDRATLDILLTSMIGELDRDVMKVVERTPYSEVQLIIMRLLSIMMSRVKSGYKASTGESSTFCSTSTAMALFSSGIIDHCLQVLKVLLDYWKSIQNNDSSTSVTGNLLKPHPSSPPPDMSPFFLRQYVKGHASDVFEAYPQLLTEMVLRLPYQIKKIISTMPSAPAVIFNQAWYSYLCEYMMMQQTPFIRRQVRKLLLFICGSKDKYRQLRDFHSLESHLKNAKIICHQGGFDGQLQAGSVVSLSYDSLIVMIEHLKACTEIATSRTGNWQKFCQKDESILSFLIHVSFLLDEGVSSIILQLLQCSLCGSGFTQQSQSARSGTPQATSSPAKQKKADQEKPDEGEDKSDEAQCMVLAQQVNKFVDKKLLSQFITSFLLDSNSTSVRWQAHSLIYNLHRNSSSAQQESLLDLMWMLWPQLPSYGRKAVQFVDLLGYFTLKTQQPEKKAKEYIEKALSVLHHQNQLLMNHPNSNIYNSIQGLVEFDGFYLESEPCLVCNNPEVAYTNIKLSAIKVDSRFTTTTQIVKLIGSHTISKITLRIGDLKRNKMVRNINIYYNNRSVQSVVELKNRPSIWHKAKKCNLAAGQTELKIEFPLPIIACNLMIEYADFYENIQASSETLQCPRCSASVPANPGVCANCGENVFQCHKCRAINYDEKDPFLCNSCGFCKYAKFDYTLTAKPCCAVDPIENEEDRKKAINTINTLLEKADRVYKQLMTNKPALELLLLRIQEHGLVDRNLEEEVGASTAAVASTTVNRAIQQLGQKYCTDCKASFDELSKIVQKVLASRKELVEYERKQKETKKTHSLTISLPIENIVSRTTPEESTPVMSNLNLSSGKCYGCISSAVEHCITLLRALATSVPYRQILCNQGLICELVEYNLRHGSVQVRLEVRHLLCLLTRDNSRATADLNNLLMERISVALKGNVTSPDLASAVRHEVALLALSLQKEDSCWEQRLRYVMQLFLMGVNSRSPVVMESITLPCLKILQILIKPEPPLSKRNKDKNLESLATVKPSGMKLGVDLRKWLSGDQKNSYRSWKQHCTHKPGEILNLNSKKVKREEVRSRYLMEKYGMRWKEKTMKQGPPLKLLQSNWLRQVMFNPSCRQARTVACSLVESLCQVPSRCREVLDMLTSYLDDLGSAGESAAKFLSLYQSLIRPAHWKHYLALKGLLPHLGNLITAEIQRLTYLEESTLNADLSQGVALKMLTELLASFIEVDSIRQHYKSRLVGCVLNGYLSLRKLVVQRTKLIDETQDKLLDLLEEMTTGTETETESFMSVCVATVKKYGLEDLRTPVFIFERLCSLIYPEENDIGEFFITLEKDPQQEDFLQGRMLGNPYSSNEPGMGPLMRDVKNKICQDCELVALLEDDNGMELLVNNKIISLDLPVKEVYRKVWCVENNETEAMRIVYRMRGLLGDATEEFIESLDAKDSQEVNNEEVYRLANVMSRCGGLEVMLERLGSVDDLARGRPLLTVLLKLFGFCIKVRNNRQKLINPKMNTIHIMLGILRLALTTDNTELLQGTPGGPTIPEQLLQIMEVILVEAAAQPIEAYRDFCQACGNQDDVTFLLSQVGTPLIKNNPNLLQLLMRVVPFLTFGNEEKMEVLINHFKPYMNFNKFDFEHSTEDDLQLECFCNLTVGIERNANGNQLKELMVTRGIVKDALEYLILHAPPENSLLVASENWKEFTSKPALKYVLRILTGFSKGHETSQLLISTECIPIIHKLEQVSSDEHVGSLAENLMEALKENTDCAEKIEDVRKQTRDEKKRLAMAMREKQLGALGMRTNEKGQVTAKSSILKQMEDLGDEAGLVCIICREGYKFQPTKVLGIYTFTKRCNVDDFENKPRKTAGYSTVTHFNIVHVDCHMAAVRHARGRDEWESAALQNANTKCNGLLPLWGPQVPESAFASCLARHNTYIQECTGHRDVGYMSTLHDLKLLLLRFAQEKSFSEDSGGGGPQSNIHLIPYILHMVLYVINTTRCVAREEKNLSNFLEMSHERQIENCFESESPLYWVAAALVVYSPNRWQAHRCSFISRMLLLAQVRHVSPQGTSAVTDHEVKDFSVYKPYLMFLGLVDGIYSTMFKKVIFNTEEEWPVSLAEYIRHNDQPLLELGDKLLRTCEDQLLPCQSFEEFCDVLDLLTEIFDPEAFLQDSLNLKH